MNKLELKHIAPYLPYSLKMQTAKHQLKYGECTVLTLRGVFTEDDGELGMEFIYDDDLVFQHHMKPLKPLLRPLSDLTKEIEHNGERFVPVDKIKANGWTEFPYSHNGYEAFQFIRDEKIDESMPYAVVQLLLKWHFDVFNLIEQNLAIDINTLNL